MKSAVPHGVVDVTDECKLGKPARKRDAVVDHIILHRFDGNAIPHWPRVVDAVGMAYCFATHVDLRDTVGRMAYSIVVTPSGVVEQAVPLSKYTPHARRWNRRSIGVAVMGDFRNHPPTTEQEFALAWLVPALACYYGAKVVRHDDLPGSSSQKGKVCPGRFLNVEGLAAWTRTGAQFVKSLEPWGFVA